MRYCPKCGDKYEDTDFRTICASCMVSLTPYTESAQVRSGPAHVERAQVLQAATMPTVTMTSPTITMPEVKLPEMPTLPPETSPIDPPPSEPQPSPLTPPFIPQPHPDEPQPTIIPTPEPMPQPLPNPNIPEPSHRRPLEKKTSLPVSRVQPQTAQQTGPDSRVRRRLTPEEVTAGKSAANGFLVGGLIIGAVALISFFNTQPENFGFFTLIFNGGMIYLGVYLIRQSIYRSLLKDVTVAEIGQPRLGAPLRFEVTLSALQELTITEAELTVTCEERVINGEGKSRTTYRHKIFTRTIPIVAAGTWSAGSVLVLNPQITIPEEAMPSFAGRHNHIEWSGYLWVGIPGKYPDVRKRIPLTIPSVRAKTTVPERVWHRYALPNLGDLHGEISLECAVDNEGLPLFPAGRQIPFSLHLQPTEENSTNKLCVELSYTIVGDGDKEQMTVDRVQCFRRGWQAGAAQQESAFLTVPQDCPLSYQGKHMNVYWAVTVREEVPWRKDRQQVFAVHVVPDIDA